MCIRDSAYIDRQKLESAYELAVQARQFECNVLVHCSMGASRSVAVAIYILGRVYSKHDYDFWLDVVRMQREFINPSLKLRELVTQFWDHDANLLQTLGYGLEQNTGPKIKQEPFPELVADTFQDSPSKSVSEC